MRFASAGCDTNFIARWKKRFVAERLAGLYSHHTGRVTSPRSERKEARILKWTLQKKPSDGSTHWSSRTLATEFGGGFAHDHCPSVVQARHPTPSC